MSGTQPPLQWNHLPPAPARYPPPSAPADNSSPATYCQFPPPGAPGQYPPHSGYPTQWPSGSYSQHSRYPGPGQHPIPSAPTELPSSIAPGLYPASTAPCTYPLTGAPVQYPMSYGQYPSPGGYPGGSGQYPPHGRYPPLGAPGQYPQPGGYPPAPAADACPSIGATGYGVENTGEDTVDSDGVDYICARHSTNPVRVEFQNRTGTKIVLMEGDKRGKFSKVEKLKNGESVEFDSYETHPFWATTTKESCKGYPVINGNLCYFLEKTCGGPSRTVDITIGPHVNHLRSASSGPPVTVKFSNRTRESVLIKAIDVNGHAYVIKNLSARKAWLYTSFEGQYFTACQTGREQEKMDMNLGEFYLARQGNNHRITKKVIITEPEDSDSSDSSCSDSSSSDSDY